MHHEQKLARLNAEYHWGSENAPRQGERELVAEFKTRFDDQGKSNLGGGVGYHQSTTLNEL